MVGEQIWLWNWGYKIRKLTCLDYLLIIGFAVLLFRLINCNLNFIYPMNRIRSLCNDVSCSKWIMIEVKILSKNTNPMVVVMIVVVLLILLGIELLKCWLVLAFCSDHNNQSINHFINRSDNQLAKLCFVVVPICIHSSINHKIISIVSSYWVRKVNVSAWKWHTVFPVLIHVLLPTLESSRCF